MEHLHKCVVCFRYTLEKQCPLCHTQATIPRPPKFSIDDKYASLRREARKAEFQKKGLY